MWNLYITLLKNIWRFIKLSCIKANLKFHWTFQFHLLGIGKSATLLKNISLTFADFFFSIGDANFLKFNCVSFYKIGIGLVARMKGSVYDIFFPLNYYVNILFELKH